MSKHLIIISYSTDKPLGDWEQPTKRAKVNREISLILLKENLKIERIEHLYNM